MQLEDCVCNINNNKQTNKLILQSLFQNSPGGPVWNLSRVSHPLSLLIINLLHLLWTTSVFKCLCWFINTDSSDFYEVVCLGLTFSNIQLYNLHIKLLQILFLYWMWMLLSVVLQLLRIFLWLMWFVRSWIDVFCGRDLQAEQSANENTPQGVGSIPHN